MNELLSAPEIEEQYGISSNELIAGDVEYEIHDGICHFKIRDVEKFMASQQNTEELDIPERTRRKLESLKQQTPETSGGILDYFQRNLLGVLGVLVGVVGVLISFYLFNLSNTSKAPVFIVDSVRTEILNSERVSRASIKVTRADGTEIKSDLTAIRFYFWNNGQDSIKKATQDVLEELQISLDDDDGEILDYSILKYSREGITDFRLTRSAFSPKRILNIDFKILEFGDGVTGQIIYEGDPRAKFSIKGVVEGVEEINTNIINTSSVFWHALTLSSTLLMFIIGIVLVVTLNGMRQVFLNQLEAQNGKKIFRWAIVIIILAVLTLMFNTARQDLERNPAQIVPQTIYPDSFEN